VELDDEVDFFLVEVDGDGPLASLRLETLFIEPALDLLAPYEQGVGRNALHQEDIRPIVLRAPITVSPPRMIPLG